MSATSPQAEGRSGPVAVKWGLVTLLVLAAATGLAFAGTQPFASNPGLEFLADNKERAGVTETESGLQYEVLSPGQGESPIASDTVAVHYRGTLTDGTQFDSSYERGQPAIFRLDQVIPGWTEGVQLMKPGAKYRFVIPPQLGYGPQGAPPVIPPNAVLQFDVELLAVKPRE